MGVTQVMVVEDESITALHIQRSLSRLGYEVPAVVAYGEEAVEKAEGLRPDLVLMDIVLKGRMDGVEAAEHIRDRLQIPVIFLTAHTDIGTWQRAKVTDPFGYLIKPFDERTLHTTIEIALYKNSVETKLDERSQELTSLLQVARILAQPISFQEKFKAILKELCQVAQADQAIMRVPSEDGAGLQLTATAGPGSWKRPESLLLQGSISGAVFQEGRHVTVNEYPSHPLAEPTAVAQGVRSLLSMPIKISGHTVGVVNIASTNPDHFSPSLVRLLTALGEGLGTI